MMEEQKFSAPSFPRQASFGCLGAILFGGLQPVYGFVLGPMISVFFFF
jgi:ATP-binding cassette subfamily B (MDR/TAP) protein 1